MNPYEPPQADIQRQVSTAQTDRNVCPVCEVSLRRWDVWNSVLKYRCRNCGSKIHLEVERRLNLWYTLVVMVGLSLGAWAERAKIGGIYGWNESPVYLAVLFSFFGGLWLQWRYGKLVANS